VHVALDDDQAIAQDAPQEATQLRRLDEVVRLVDQDFGQRLGVGQHQAWLVEEAFEGDQAIVGHLVHPF